MIALVVTIIILLILAGVTIATLTGDNGLLTKAGEAKNASEQANLEEEVQLAFIENQADKYFNSNSNIQDKLKSIFEKSYGQGNIEVNKSGKNYKVIVKDTKTRYRVRFDGKVEKYEEIDHATNVYAKLDDDGILYLRATPSNGYSSYENSSSIQQDWNSSRNASRSSVQKVIIEEPIAPSSCYEFFHEFSNLKKIENIELLHLEKTKSMNDMFSGCTNLNSIDLTSFDTSNVETMSYLFSRCYLLETIDLSNFDTSNVSSMFGMFSNCRLIKEIDLQSINTSRVSSMGKMFNECIKIERFNLDTFNTDNVTDMSNMFHNCSSIKELDLSEFNISKVTNMCDMFSGCDQLQNLDLSNFNTSKVSTMVYLFSRCSSLKVVNLGKLFVINDSTNINNMFTKFDNIKIIAKSDTVNRLKAKFTDFTDNNFEIIE